MWFPPVYQSLPPLVSTTIPTGLTVTIWVLTQGNKTAGPQQWFPLISFTEILTLLLLTSLPLAYSLLTHFCSFSSWLLLSFWQRFYHTRQDFTFSKASVITNKTWSKKQHLKLLGRAEFVRSQGSWQGCSNQQEKENSFCLWCWLFPGLLFPLPSALALLSKRKSWTLAARTEIATPVYLN